MKTALVILCLILTGCDQLKPTPTFARYQLVGDSNASGHAWKIDTVTGEVWLCAIGGTGSVACHPAEQRQR